MGSAPISFGNGQNVIFSTFNGAIVPNFNDCVGLLNPGGMCTTQAAAAHDQAYACKVITVGTTGTVRATMRANDINNRTLIEEDLR
jgi:hypothetical protein